MTTGSRRGGVLFGLLISALVLVCLFWVVRDFSIRTAGGREGGNVSIQTPVGDLNVRAHHGVAPESFGVPIYPGARLKESGKSGGGAVVEWISRDGTSDKGISVEGVSLETADPAKKVMAFYRSRLPNWIVEKERGHRLQLELREGGYKRVVAIDENEDGTRVGIATVGDPPAN